MVVIVVVYGVVDVFWYVVDFGQQFFDVECGQVVVIFEGFVEVCYVCCVMFVVMDFYCVGVDVGFESVECVVEGRNFMYVCFFVGVEMGVCGVGNGGLVRIVEVFCSCWIVSVDCVMNWVYCQSLFVVCGWFFESIDELERCFLDLLVC